MKRDGNGGSQKKEWEEKKEREEHETEGMKKTYFWGGTLFSITCPGKFV